MSVYGLGEELSPATVYLLATNRGTLEDIIFKNLDVSEMLKVITFSNVRKLQLLSVGGYVEFLFTACPNVEHLVIDKECIDDDFKDLLLSKLTRLSKVTLLRQNFYGVYVHKSDWMPKLNKLTNLCKGSPIKKIKYSSN